MTDEEALEILDKSFQNEATFDQIWFAIEQIGQDIYEIQ